MGSDEENLLIICLQLLELVFNYGHQYNYYESYLDTFLLFQGNAIIKSLFTHKNSDIVRFSKLFYDTYLNKKLLIN